MSTEKAKISNSNNELQSIESQISTISKELDDLRKSGKNDELSTKQISELELNLKDLEDKKSKIITNTQQKLPTVNDENLTNKDQLDKGEKIKYEKTKDEIQRTQAIEIVEKIKDNPTDIDIKSIDGNVFGVLFKLLKVVFGGNWSVDNFLGVFKSDGKEDEEVSKVREKLKDPNRIIGEFDFENLINSKEGKSFRKYQNDIIKYTTRFDINPGIVLKLFIKEGSHGNPGATPGNSSAIGLGQIITPTWNIICDDIGPKQYGVHIDKQKDRFDPSKQILASCLYLDYCARLKEVNHETAMIYYHMGHGRNITDETAKRYYNSNPAIARVHGRGPITAASYQEAAKKYYLV